MATLAEINQLKQSWYNDPIWDLEETEGFEDHKEELKAYRTMWEQKWEAAYLAQNSNEMKLAAKEIDIDNMDLVSYIINLEKRIEAIEDRLNNSYFI